jgi:hypothetical protein
MVSSGPTVGEPTIGPPAASAQSCFGARLGAAPARRPVCWASPLYMANGGEPGGCVAPAGSLPATRAPSGSAGSTHVPAVQTRPPLQSLSLPQPAVPPWRPTRAPGQAAITAAHSQPSAANPTRNAGRLRGKAHRVIRFAPASVSLGDRSDRPIGA